MPTIRGSCQCGGVKFEIAGPLSGPLNCHCSQCRKQHGAAFRSRVRVRIEDFRWVDGEQLVKYYEGPSGFLRGFCGECGSPILNRAGPNWNKAAEFPRTLSEYGIPLAILDDPPHPARLPCLCRQQGAVVRDHRRSAAICGISAAGLEPRQVGMRWRAKQVAPRP